MSFNETLSHFLPELSLRPSGDRNLRGNCPFHEGTSSRRSLYIRTAEGSWCCFSESCGARGSLPMLLLQLGKPRHIVDHIMGEVNPYLQKTAPRPRVETDHLLPEALAGVFALCPLGMIKAGFTEEILQEYDVGYDTEQDRITFCIRDYLGRLVGISGRAMKLYQIPRYKVYGPADLRGSAPEGYVSDNRQHLYGLDKIYPARIHDQRLEEPILVVEGYKGTLSLVQKGYQACALQGSSLTSQQGHILQRLPGPYYIWLDLEPGKHLPDASGRCAALSIARSLLRGGRVMLPQYPEGLPVGTAPDDLSPDQVREAVEGALSPTVHVLKHTAAVQRTRS